MTLRVRPPLLAEATIVYVPAGVIELGGFGFEPPTKGIARPAPHPVTTIKQPSSAKANNPGKRFLRDAIRPNGNNVASQNMLSRFVEGRESAELVTPVRIVTDTVVVLPRATLAGVTLHVEFAGAPAHVKVAVPGMFAAEPSNSG